MTDNFVVTLISNGSMMSYPQNTGNNFTNRLGEAIDLRGVVINEDMNWEVAMADFQYTNVFDQINKAIDCRIALVYPAPEDEEEVTREAEADEAANEEQEAAARQESLETNEITPVDPSAHDDALAALHEAGLVTRSDNTPPPAKRAKKDKDKGNEDKVLTQNAREAWQKGLSGSSASKGIGALMFDHEYSKPRRYDEIDESIKTYIGETFHYLRGKPDKDGFKRQVEPEVAVVQVKIGRGNYESPVAIAYIMAATFNMVIKQLVNRPTLNTQLRVEVGANGKINFVCDDIRVHHTIFMDDKRLADILGLRTTKMHPEGPSLYKAERQGTGTPLLTTYVPNMFIYCDVVADQYVGDVMAPLLELVPVKHAAMGERMQYSLIPPTYLEVARKYIDTIHVEIRDDKGVPVPFDDSKGTVVVRLHFRRKGVMPSFVM